MKNGHHKPISARDEASAGAPGDRARRPTIGLTIGDPAGIGAEVVVKALADESLREKARFLIYGTDDAVSFAADQVETSPYWARITPDDDRRLNSGVALIDFDEYPTSSTEIGKSSARGGEASMRFMEEAIVDARRGVIDAIVTGPISKTSWRSAGFKYPGHTELLAHRFKTNRVAMMFVGGPLRVALASVHEPLFELRNSFTIGRVFQPIDLLHEALQSWFGIPQPRIGVAGLNPHASEGGLFGDEERRIVEPAIAMAQQHDIRVEGPLPADTLFWRAARGEFDGVVAMYHDQGLIPVKLLAFDSAVNITLGLPIIRTSVDHGTAFDIAGRNRADPGSMKAAIETAIMMAQRAAAIIRVNESFNRSDTSD